MDVVFRCWCRGGVGGGDPKEPTSSGLLVKRAITVFVLNTNNKRRDLCQFTIRMTNNEVGYTTANRWFTQMTSPQTTKSVNSAISSSGSSWSVLW